MRRAWKIVACLLVAIIAGAGASTGFRAATEPPEIRNWRNTGVLRFDRPVTEDYAQRINQEVRAEILRADILRRYKGPAIVPLFGTAAGYAAGMLLDPLLLVIEAIAFALSWLAWPMVARQFR